MAEDFLLLAGLIFLLAFDFLAIAARTGFMQTNSARLLTYRDQADVQVNRAIHLLHVQNRIKATLNLTLISLRFSLAGLLLLFLTRQPWKNPSLVAAGALLLGALVLFWFEAGVERLAAADAEKWALRLAPFTSLLAVVLKPFVFLISNPGETQSLPEGTTLVTEDELKTLVDAGQEEGVFEQGERRMIYSIFQLGETLAREIMVPRIDVLALDVNTSLPDAVDALLSSGHSRVPVYEENIDKTLGLLYAKDLLRVWREGGQLDSLRDLLRPAYFVPEAKHVDDLLAEIQSQRIHMAIIVDEYGGVAGLVTLEDIVEEILGEIQDEYDQAEESPYQVLKNGDYLFQGRIDLDDFNEIMNSSLPVEEADTLSGFIYSRVGRVPYVGDKVQEKNLELIVEQVSARRIRKVRARRLAPSEAPEGGEKEHEDQR